MLVCNFCHQEILPNEGGIKARVHVDNWDASQQPQDTFDFHPDCGLQWWNVARSATGPRPGEEQTTEITAIPTP